MISQKGIIEGLLYISGDEGLTSEKLSLVLELDEENVLSLLNEIKEEYLNDENKGIELVDYAGKYKFVSKEGVSDYARKLYEQLPSNSFSNAALETLSIIAYKQPITRTQIEEIRGVSCELIVHKLLARGLIREAGRAETAGRPYLYEVTEAFLDSFKLGSLKELPKLPDFDSQQEEKDLFE